jgi:hypothetical protein
MILRNVVATIWWLGRDLAEGQAPNLERLTELPDFVGQVTAFGDGLRAVVQREMGGRE